MQDWSRNSKKKGEIVIKNNMSKWSEEFIAQHQTVGKLKKFSEQMGVTIRQIGSSASKVMENLEKQDKEMNEKMKRILNSANI